MATSDDGNYILTIHDIPAGERPRERLEHYGATALSNVELIAILLRSGVQGENVITLSTHLLIEHGGLPGLARAGFNQLSEIKGIGPAKTCQLKAAFELGRRLMIAAPTQRPQITCPADAANLIMPDMSLLDQEHLRIILLDTKNYVMASPTIYKGNVNSSVIRVSEIFKHAVRENSTALIVAHNHPSGDPTPSPEDAQVTGRIVEAGRLLDIEVLDHIIIGHQRFVSLKEKGVGF
ncbi:MAG: DNA repair protein RadC [Anaerolineae bacterium]